MKLSIVIPTRNRANALDATLATFCQIIESSPRKRDVELVCVDNFSQDNTQAVCNRYASAHSFVRYFHHAKERHSAETSAFNAIDFACGEYVWLFGDDDTPLEGCIETVLGALDEYSPPFVLLNSIYDRGARAADYITSVNPLIYFPSGLDFFKRFGLITAVTTISCICFRKSTFNRALFEEFAKISEIYSHSFALFANYHNAPILFVAPPVVKYLPNPEPVELERIGGHCRAKGLPTYFSFGHGLARLIAAASRITGVSVATIAAFEEMVINKVTFSVHPMLLSSFIVRIFISQHQNDPLNRFRAEDIAELQAIAARLNNPTISVCWNACLQLSAPDCCAQDAAVIQRVNGILHDFERQHFESLRCENPDKHVHSIYFQNSVALYDFASDGSAEKRTLPSLVIAIRVDGECEPTRVLAALEHAQSSLKGISAEWILWNCSDSTQWQRAVPSAHVLDTDELPVQQLSELGEYVVFLRPNSLLFPNVLLFGLDALMHRAADAAVFDAGVGWENVANYLGLLRKTPSTQVIREMQPEEGRKAYALLEACRGELPMVVAAGSLLGCENARVLQINSTLSTADCFVSQPCETLSNAANSISQPGDDVLSALVAMNHLTTSGLLSANSFAPVSAEKIGEFYSRCKPDIETPMGALAVENLLLLLAVRRCWENAWEFNKTAQTRLVMELHELNSTLLSGDRAAQSNCSFSKMKPNSTLRMAQHELTVAYKATNPYVTRFAAWTTVLGLKVSKRLLAAPRTDRARRDTQSMALPLHN